ncbi:MAG TPA: zf-TFIIB domain-containing protein [Candidatus Sulfobium mesophilum]|jgi:Zn-finger nucleic acid-binding protein|nr:zf-TFIIB domain-containing protein [Candidatus Sulfobium mesophilum]
MQCPICSIELVMFERQGVEIDYCQKCRGVWLDHGELDKIIEKSVQAPASGHDELNRLREQYHNQYGHHKYRHGHKRKKSFV